MIFFFNFKGHPSQTLQFGLSTLMRNALISLGTFGIFLKLKEGYVISTTSFKNYVKLFAYLIITFVK